MRNKLRTLGLIISSICLLGVLPALAQTEGFRQSIGINAKASNNGFGGDVYYRPYKNWAIKAGYETLNMPVEHTLEEDNITLNTEFKFETGATSLSAIYQPFGGLYLIAGAAMLNLKPSIYGVPSGDYAIGDITIPAARVGDIRVTISPERKIAPYAGFGIGNAFPRDWPVSFSLEFGAFYMGAPKLDIQATGMLAPNADPDHIATLENEIKDFTFYPVIKFNLGIRLFTFGKK